MASQDLKERVAVGRIKAGLLDREQDARDGRRTVAPAADAQGGADVGDGGHGVGIFKSRQDERAGVLALDRGEAPGAPVTGRSVIVKLDVRVAVAPSSSKTLVVTV